MKKFFLCCVGSLLVCGCAETHYIKAGATPENFEADKVECHNQILMSPAGANLARAQMSTSGARGVAIQSTSQSARRDVGQCLRAKGWVAETK